MRNLKRTVAMVLAVVMVLSLVVAGVGTMTAEASSYWTPQQQPTYETGSGVVRHDPNNFRDIRGHWAQVALGNAITNGILQGNSATTVAPDAYITRAEMATLMARAFEATQGGDVSSFIDIKPAAWYYSYVSRAVQMGVMAGNGNAINPNGNITRQDAAIIFARAFNLYGYTANLGAYSDSSSIASYARDAMAACVGAGVVQGSGGRLNPNGVLTRAEFVTMLYRLVQYYVNSAVALTASNIPGSVLVTVPNITLNNTSITGNLYIGDGVGVGTITLDGVQVGGTIYVRGGTSLRLTGASRVKNIVVYSFGTSCDIIVDEGASVSGTIIDTAVSQVTLTGKVGDVTLNTGKVNLNLKGATVGTLNANVTTPNITVGSDSTVNVLTSSVNANGANITIDGKVNTMTFGSNDVKVNVSTTGSVSNMTMSSTNSTVDIAGNVGNFTVGTGATGNKVTVSGKVDHADLGTGGSNEITATGNGSIGNLTNGGGNQKLSIQAYQYTLDHKASNSTTTFTQGTAIDNLTITGQNVGVVVETGAGINNVAISGANAKISGQGTVKEVVVNPGGGGSVISTPNTHVVNNSGADVYLGNIVLPTGYDMTTDASGNGQKIPGLEDLQAKTSTITLSMPTRAEAADLGIADYRALSAFGTGMAYNSSANTVSGTFKKIGQVSTMVGTAYYDGGYFIPLVCSLQARTDDFVVTCAGKTYYKSDLCDGTRYKNQLIILVPLDPAATNKTVEVSYDADGSGTEYKNGYVTVTYSGASYVADSEFELRANSAHPAPGVNGGAALSISSVSVGDSRATYYMTCDVLDETDNGQGTKGAWGGIQLVGPRQAKTASYVVDVAGAQQTYTATLGTTNISGNTYPVFTHYENLGSEAIQKAKALSIIVTWKDANNRQVGETETFILDINGVNVNTTGKPVTPADPDAIVGVVRLSSGEFNDYESNATTADFGSPINVTGNSLIGANIGGTYNKVRIMSNSGGVKYDGYYAPVRFEITGITKPFTMKAGDKTILQVTQGMITGTTDSNGVMTEFPIVNNGTLNITVLIQLDAVGSQVQDFDITVEDSATTDKKPSVSFKVDCSQAAVTDKNLSVQIANASTTIGGLAANAFGSFTATPGAMTATVTGTAQKVTVTDAPDGYGLGWFIPVTITRQDADATAWSVDVFSTSTNTTGLKWEKSYSVGMNTSSVTVLVPIATLTSEAESEGILWSAGILTVKPSTGSTTQYSVRFDDVIKSGAPSEFKAPEGTTKPEPEPETPTMTVSTTAVTGSLLGGPTVAELGNGITVTGEGNVGGTFNYVSFPQFNGAIKAEQEGHYLVVDVKADAGLKVRVTNRSDGAKGGKVTEMPADGITNILWLDGKAADYVGTAAAGLADKTAKIELLSADETTVHQTIILNWSSATLKEKEPDQPEPSAPAITIGVSSETFYGKAPAEFSQNLSVDALVGDKYVLHGNMLFIENFTEFNGTVTAEQSGNYFPLKFTGEPGLKFRLTSRSDGAKNGKVLTIQDNGQEDVLLWLSGTSDGYAGSAAVSLASNTAKVEVLGSDGTTVTDTYYIDWSKTVMSGGGSEEIID